MDVLVFVFVFAGTVSCRVYYFKIIQFNIIEPQESEQ